MTPPLVSVVVPAYKHEQFIVDCLQSIYAQTHERIELIFIDDCSPDRTFDIASSLLKTAFGKRFENIVIRKKPLNCGAHDSLNQGMELANGDYIAFLNSDDLYRPKRIETMLQNMKESGSDFSFSLVDFINDDANYDSIEVPESLELLPVKQVHMVDREISIGFSLLKKNISISTGNFILSANLLKKIGKFINLKYCHDWDFILQSLIYTEPLLVKEILYDYRIHKKNSFKSYGEIAEIETEVVIRRFFRATQMGVIENPACPAASNWPFVFEAFLLRNGLWDFWSKENGFPQSGHRIYDSSSSLRGRNSIGAKGIRHGFSRLLDERFPAVGE